MHRDQVKIPSPCHAAWSAMDGDRQRRFCDACSTHVHDLSAMTEADAVKLLDAQPNACVRYAVGADGKIAHAAEGAANADANANANANANAAGGRGSRWVRAAAVLAAVAGGALGLASPASASGVVVPEAEATDPAAADAEPTLLERIATRIQEWSGATPEVVVSQGQVVTMGKPVAEPPPPPPPPPPTPPIERLGRRVPPPTIRLPTPPPTPPAQLPRPEPGASVIPEVQAELDAQQ